TGAGSRTRSPAADSRHERRRRPPPARRPRAYPRASRRRSPTEPLLRPAGGDEGVMPADAEAAIALRVAIAVVQAGDVVPDADEMKVAGGAEERLVRSARAAFEARFVAGGGDEARVVAAPHFEQWLGAELCDRQRDRCERIRHPEGHDSE